jgi:hypothetical protein
VARTEERFQKRLPALVRAGRERLIDLLNQALEAEGSHRPGSISRADLTQLAEGFAAVVQEAIAARSNEVQTLYVEAVVPGLLRHGGTAESVTSLMRGWLDGIGAELGQQLGSLRDGDEATQWLAGFSRAFMAEVERAARGGGARPVAGTFFEELVTMSGLAELVAPNVLERVCEMTGIDAEHLSAAHVGDILRPLRKAMSIFMGNPEMDRALKRLEALCPAPVEEPASH